MTFHICYNVFL